jgi:Uri superfamily endonuclease
MKPKPGTYALILSSSNHSTIQIGRLGELKLRPGFYVYIGSAFGPGGLHARIEHHKHITQKPQWHIDYLSSFTTFKNVWFTYDSQHREHQWAQMFQNTFSGFISVKGFGASDCKCESHLFFLKSNPPLKSFQKLIRKSYPEHEVLRSLLKNNL